MPTEVSRRNFLSQLGVTAGTVAAAATVPLVGGPALISRAEAQPKGKIPDTPYKVGHMTFHTGAAAVLGEPMYKGHILAAEEINAKGGLLGKRKIETVKADENAGTDANVKELRRMKLSEKIDFFTG
ncbi:MAG TPA: ABC transporter substrate-binding protein, partial [Methylomirabilota bacterium]